MHFLESSSPNMQTSLITISHCNVRFHLTFSRSSSGAQNPQDAQPVNVAFGEVVRGHAMIMNWFVE